MDELLNPLHPKNPRNIDDGTKPPPPTTPPNAINEEAGSGGSKWERPEGAEPIPLPSKGVFYLAEGQGRYWNMESLMVRQLNYTDEDILTTRAYFENLTVFNEILRNVIVDPNRFPYSSLVPVDRDTILLWLRSKAFGNEFEIEYTCPECKIAYPVIWDISTFDIPTYEDYVYEQLKTQGEFTVELPQSGVRVRLTVPSIGQSADAEKRMLAKKQAKRATNDFYGTSSLMLIVAGVEDNGRVMRNKNEIENFFNKINLTLGDSRFIRKQAERLNIKYNTAKACECPHCNHIVEGVEMPIYHPNFFWPDTGI